MISIRGLGFGYPGGRPALAEISLEHAKGLTLGLLGANGSGKSTLLAILAGIFTPTHGQVRVADVLSPDRQAEMRRVTGLMLQDADLQILGSTVGEDICLGLNNPDDPLAKELAARFGLLERWNDPVQTLSTGQKRKLCLAAVLRGSPQVLLYDEPFAGLDYPAALELRRIVAANRAEGLTQVVASHDLDCLDGLVDAWAVLHRGQLVLHGAGDAVFPHLERYGVRPPAYWLAAQGRPAWPAAADPS